MQTLQVPGHTQQISFTPHRIESPQVQSPESHHLFDDTEYPFHCGFAFGIDAPAFSTVHAMCHFCHRVRLFGAP